MEFYPDDALAGAALVLSIILLLVSSASYARARARRLLLPVGAYAAVLAVSAWQVLGAASSSAPPREFNLAVSLVEFVALIVLALLWLSRGGRRKK